MKNNCPKCKYFIITEYKAQYGGCVVGCSSKTATNYKNCFVPKDTNDNKTSNSITNKED